MIGIFDSGVGGLTVLKETIKELPLHDLIYFGDTARAPYGNKSKDVIAKYALEDADFLIRKGAKIIIIACNTASSAAYEILKKQYPETPIFEVITPAVSEALKKTKNHKIGIIGTRATISSGIYEKKLKETDPAVNVITKSCPLFAPFIEEGWIEKPELKMVARRYLSKLKSNGVDTLILGCTHYPFISNIIQARMGRRTRLINSATAIACQIKKFLDENENINSELSKNGRTDVYFSDLTEQAKSISNKYLKENFRILSV